MYQAANDDKKTKKGKQVLDSIEFIKFVKLLTTRSELEELFLR
jgi:hypothetical protein